MRKNKNKKASTNIKQTSVDTSSLPAREVVVVDEVDVVVVVGGKVVMTACFEA